MRAHVVTAVLVIAACGGEPEPPRSPPPPPATVAPPPIPPPTASVAAAGPTTPKRPVVTEYHGVKVTDDYAWLENGADPEVKAWSDEQNKRARGFLDGLPERAAVKERVRQLVGGVAP